MPFNLEGLFTRCRIFFRTFFEESGVYLAGGFQLKLRTVEGNALSGQLTSYLLKQFEIHKPLC